VSYEPQIGLAGGVVHRVPTDAAGGFKMTPEQLDAAIGPKTRMLILNTPSNPCGTAYTRDELAALAKVVESASSRCERGLTVLCDEIYEKLVYNGTVHTSFASLPGMGERTITINGMSKAFAMTGWRLGYLAGSGDEGLKIAGACKKLQSQLNTSVATFLLPAMRVALQECAEEVESMRAAFEKRGALMHGMLTGIDGVACPEPTGAFYCFADVSAHFGKAGPNGEAINTANDFAAALLESQHVACVAGTDFGTPGERCVRFTFACGEDQIRAGMEKLGAFVASLG
jgi:aspartate/methionine/tyrosine aminotransferase